MTIPPLIAVALGGALGASLRYGFSTAVNRHWESSFPIAILSINIMGSCLMGVALGLLTRIEAPALLSPFLLTGVLGGFTTFSTFSVEAVTLWQASEFGQAAAYVLLSVFGALLGLALGLWLAKGAL